MDGSGYGKIIRICQARTTGLHTTFKPWTQLRIVSAIYGKIQPCFCMFVFSGGAGKARFNVATPTYEARTRPLHVQHTYYRIIFKQNPFNIISRGVQR